MDLGNDTDNEISKVISTEYGIDSIISLSSPPQGGYLIETRRQAYWLKPMPFKSHMKSIYYEDAFTRHLKLHGYPARCLVRTLQGKLIMSISDMQYVLTEYQKGAMIPISNQKLSPPQLARAGEMLARLHLLSISYGGPKRHRQPYIAKKSFDVLRKVKEKILAMDVHKAEGVALEAIERKLSFIVSNPFEAQPFVLRSRLVNHGDYHAGNIVFDSRDEVIFVLDFEHCNDITRLWDVALGLTWLCRKRPTEAFAGVMDEHAIAEFIKAYNGIFPLSAIDRLDLIDICVSACHHTTFLLEHQFLKAGLPRSLCACETSSEWFWWADNESEVRQIVETAIR